MAEPTRSVVYEDFSKGEYGALGEREAGKHGPGFFHAHNMVRYRNGLLGPRAGLKNITPSGMPSGALRGMWFQGTPGYSLALLVGNNVLKAVAGPGGTATSIGTTAVTPTATVNGLETVTSHSNFVVPGDKTYDINHVTGVLTGYAGSPGGVAIALYGQRMMVAGAGGVGSNRIYYSAAGDFTTWPALNYFDVGKSSIVVGMWAQRGHLTILMSNSEWWVLTGVPGYNDTLRRVSGGGVHPWVMNQRCAYLLGNDEIVFVPLKADYPAMFNGSIPQEFRHLSVAENDAEDVGNVTGNLAVMRAFRPDDAYYVLPDYNVFALHRQGIWTFHTLPAGLSIGAFATSDGQGRIFFAGSSGGVPQIYETLVSIDRPGFASDGECAPGDDSTTQLACDVSFPDWWSPDDKRCLARTVIVDFRTWATGGTGTNHFDVTVTALDRYNQDAPVASSTQSFDQADASGGSGVRRRVNFGLGDQGWGSGFKVALSNIRGVAIERVVVGVEETAIPYR